MGSVSLSHAKRSLPLGIPDQRDELERFKASINLTEFAASEGGKFDC